MSDVLASASTASPMPPEASEAPNQHARRHGVPRQLFINASAGCLGGIVFLALMLRDDTNGLGTIIRNSSDATLAMVMLLIAVCATFAIGGLVCGLLQLATERD